MACPAPERRPSVWMGGPTLRPTELEELVNEDAGVPMVCATSVMKPGRSRIGKISGNISLPRTVPIINLVASGVGGFIGLIFGLALGGMESIALGLGLGAGAGWMAVTYSPLRNESLLKWFELQFKSQTRTRYVNGRRVTVAVGVAIVAAPSSGSVRLLRSAVRVPAGQYDERGAVRSARNQNLEHEGAPALLAGRTAPDLGSSPLPADSAILESRRGPRRSGAPAPLHEDPMSSPALRLKD